MTTIDDPPPPLEDAPEPGFIRRHRWALLAGGVAALALAAWLAFGYFGVQTLFIDDKVDEEGPVFASGATSATTADDGADADPAPATTEPSGAADDTVDEPEATAPTITTVAAGDFIDRSHPTSGRAVVLTDGSEQRFVRFEQFATDNGPDLNVYLSTADATADEGAFDDDAIDLGDLKGNIGDQNYEIPPNVDLERYDTVVIWCVRFGVAFGAADLA